MCLLWSIISVRGIRCTPTWRYKVTRVIFPATWYPTILSIILKTLPADCTQSWESFSFWFDLKIRTAFRFTPTSLYIWSVVNIIQVFPGIIVFVNSLVLVTQCVVTWYVVFANWLITMYFLVAMVLCLMNVIVEMNLVIWTNSVWPPFSFWISFIWNWNYMYPW